MSLTLKRHIGLKKIASLLTLITFIFSNTVYGLPDKLRVNLGFTKDTDFKRQAESTTQERIEETLGLIGSGSTIKTVPVAGQDEKGLLEEKGIKPAESGISAVDGELASGKTIEDGLKEVVEELLNRYAKIHGEDKKRDGYKLSRERLGIDAIGNILEDSRLVFYDKELLLKYIAFGKGSIFTFWSELIDEEKKALIAQLYDIDRDNGLEAIERMYKKFIVDNKPGADIVVREDTLGVPELFDLTQGDTEENLRAEHIAEKEVYRKGKIAVLELAGGGGARLGYRGPKMTFKASNVMQKSLARMRAENIRALAAEYGRPIPWIIMTSDVTDKGIRSFFEQHIVNGKYFNQVPVEWVKFQPQRVMPQVIGTGEFILAEKNKVLLGGFGHGDARDYVLGKHEILEFLKKFGVEHVMMLNVDNAFFPNIRAVGYHYQETRDLKPGIEKMSLLVVEKARPDEKTGIAVLIDGKNALVEYNQIPPRLLYMTYIYGLDGEKAVFYKDTDRPDYEILEADDLKRKHAEDVYNPDWVMEHLVSIDELPDDVKFEFLGVDYNKSTLEGRAKLWISAANLNTLIWDLSCFTDTEHPLGELPVVVDKPKPVEGYHPETKEFHTKQDGRLKAYKFEIMAFHGFFIGEVQGPRIVVNRVGGFAPIKEKEGVDTPLNARRLYSQYASELLTNKLEDWYVSDTAGVELSPAFAFLDGRYLKRRMGRGGVIGRNAQLYLSGRNTTIGNSLDIKEGCQLKIRVDDEYNPESEVKIGDSVTVKSDVVFVINGGKLIIDDGVTFETDGPKQYTIQDGEILHLTKSETIPVTGETLASSTTIRPLAEKMAAEARAIISGV